MQDHSQAALTNSSDRRVDSSLAQRSRVEICSHGDLISLMQAHDALSSAWHADCWDEQEIATVKPCAFQEFPMRLAQLIFMVLTRFVLGSAQAARSMSQLPQTSPSRRYCAF